MGVTEHSMASLVQPALPVLRVHGETPLVGIGCGHLQGGLPASPGVEV